MHMILSGQVARMSEKKHVQNLSPIIDHSGLGSSNTGIVGSNPA